VFHGFVCVSLVNNYCFACKYTEFLSTTKKKQLLMVNVPINNEEMVTATSARHCGLDPQFPIG
jgi:hypothetical protein